MIRDIVKKAHEKGEKNREGLSIADNFISYVRGQQGKLQL